MLSVATALARVTATVQPFPVTNLPLSDAYGLVLAQDVWSESDSPPFDKALMDGFAVCAADLSSGAAELRLIEEVTAGQVPRLPVSPGEAIQIMTGAPLPAGADAVVRVEDGEVRDGRVVIETGSPVAPETNVMRQGTTMRRGERVLKAGTRLEPQQLGALAEMGCHDVAVRRRPRVAVLATGDELVPIDQMPGPGQIRNSNETMLVAQVIGAGGVPVPLGIARDERSHLRERIRQGLACDLLVLSGGVSAGKLDLVPSELDAAGVSEIFHKVQIKPGKPLWFGAPADGEPCCGVFGLPGNPVSSMVCCELFVRTAIRRLMGVVPAEPQPIAARLKDEFQMRGDRPTYHPAHLTASTEPEVRLVAWHGSADLRATVDANAMALFPAGDRLYPAGAMIEVLRWNFP